MLLSVYRWTLLSPEDRDRYTYIFFSSKYFVSKLLSKLIRWFICLNTQTQPSFLFYIFASIRFGQPWIWNKCYLAGHSLTDLSRVWCNIRINRTLFWHFYGNVNLQIFLLSSSQICLILFTIILHQKCSFEYSNDWNKRTPYVYWFLDFFPPVRPLFQTVRLLD